MRCTPSDASRKITSWSHKVTSAPRRKIAAGKWAGPGAVLRFDSKPARAPRQATESANQTLVAPRAHERAGDAPPDPDGPVPNVPATTDKRGGF